MFSNFALRDFHKFVAGIEKDKVTNSYTIKDGLKE